MVRKGKMCTNPTNQEGGSQTQPERRFLGSSLKPPVLKPHKVIIQRITIEFVISRMTLSQRITLKLTLVDLKMTFRFLIQSLNFPLYMKFPKLVMIEL